MLKELYIKNVAVIEEVRIDFSEGFNVLTGETGAGKSILIDSINMALGGRGGKELVRSGAEKAVVNALFSSNEKVNSLLSDFGIDAEDDVILTRQITADSKSTARINGMTVTNSVLKEVAKHLCDIHGQNDNHFLLSNRNHINFLDSYANTLDIKEKYQETYKKLKEIREKISSLNENEQEKLRRCELLEFQLNEINSAKLKKGEKADIEERITYLSNIEKILSGVNDAYESLYSADENVYDLLSGAIKSLNGAMEYYASLSEFAERLNSSLIEIEDVASELSSKSGKADFDEGEFNELNNRIDIINSLCRKYGENEEEILLYRDRIEEELSEIQGSEELLEKLLKEEKNLLDKALEYAEILSEKRKEASKKLDAEIMKELSELDMPKVVFRADVRKKKDENGEVILSSNGADEVEFLISANPGEALKPLSKIASGGELSRIMLAIKSIFADSDDAETLIFDEIDTGVSGRAAQKIAEKLSRLSRKKQVFSITHLSQLASMADNHYLIHKETRDDITRTDVTLLDEEERAKELARIIGGAYITELTLKNAKEMLNLAEEQKRG